MTWRRADLAEDDGPIRARLLSPSAEATIEELAGVWFVTTIEAVIPDYGKLAADPGLPGRIRGALGDALAGGASSEALDGRPCPFDPPCAFEALFRKQGRMTKGVELPSPWAAAAAARRADLAVSFSLFGFASEWTAAAAEAFTYSLRRLVDWKGKTQAFLPPFALASRRLFASEGVSWPAEPGAVTLEFLSPLAVSGADPRDRPAALLTGLGARLSGLARWHDLSLDARNEWRAIKSAAEGLVYEFDEVSDVRWTRGSARQDRRIPMRGILARLTITGDLRPFAPMVAMGETCHMGADAAYGCGRYRILAWD